MNQGLVMMRLTLAAFLLAVIVAALATAWTVSRAAEGAMVAQPQKPLVRVAGGAEKTGYAPQSEGEFPRHNLIPLLLTGIICVIGLAFAVYGFTVKVGERGELAKGVAALKASMYIAAGGAVIGASLIFYAVYSRHIIVALLGGAVTALNIYIVARARSGVEFFEDMILGKR